MALSIEDVGNQLYRDELHYGFYGADGTISDSLNPGCIWKLKNLRVHLSVAFVSVEYLVMRMSAGLGSAYNTVLYSQNVSGSTDIFVHYSELLQFLSDDQLVIELSMGSGTNVIGFQFDVWSARGA